MKIETSMQGRDVYLRSTDHQGRVTYSRHTVWSPELFMEARCREAQKINLKKGSKLAGVEQITEEQYKARL